MELTPSTVETRSDSGAGLIIMTGGDGGNRLTPSLLAGLTEAVRAHEADPEVRFVILRSRGTHFCLGMDLEAFLANSDETAFEKEIKAYAGLLAALNDCSKTTIAVVEGAAKAGGVGLVAACDIVVAAEDAEFELSEAYLGLIPANVMPYLLSRRISYKRAAYLVQTAAPLSARDAKELGLVEEVHQPEGLETAVKKMGRRLMRISPRATEQYKTFAADILELPIKARGSRAIDELLKIASEPGLRDGVRTFVEGETPEWFGRFKPGLPLTGSGE